MMAAPASSSSFSRKFSLHDMRYNISTHGEAAECQTLLRVDHFVYKVQVSQTLAKQLQGLGYANRIRSHCNTYKAQRLCLCIMSCRGGRVGRLTADIRCSTWCAEPAKVTHLFSCCLFATASTTALAPTGVISFSASSNTSRCGAAPASALHTSCTPLSVRLVSFKFRCVRLGCAATQAARAGATSSVSGLSLMSSRTRLPGTDKKSARLV